MEKSFKRATEEVPVEPRRYPPFGSLFFLFHKCYPVFI